MLNKKRLAMMAVAASMVLPNNLVYLATNTPVFAADEESTSTPMEETDASDDPQRLTADALKGDLEGSYYVDTNLELTSDISISKAVTIELRSEAKISSTAKNVFSIKESGSLEILGKGEIVSKSTTPANVIAIVGDSATLTLGPGITLSKGTEGPTPFIYGITLSSNENATADTATNAIVNLTGTKITTDGGININGNLSKAKDGYPLVNLTDVNIKSWAIGIYQAGNSTVNVVNSTIESDVCGIETRAGNLRVSGDKSKITATGKYIESQDLKVTPNGNGATTINAGIAIAQHNTKAPIDVQITKATVSGPYSIAITDPQNIQTQEKDETISLVVSGATLSGPVGYSTNTIKFTIIGIGNGEIKKLEKGTDNFYKPSETQPSEDESVPYTKVEASSSTATTSASIPSKDLTNLSEDEQKTGILSSKNQASLEKTLGDTLTEASKSKDTAIIKPYSKNGKRAEEPVPFKYNYTVKLDGTFATLPNGDYLFPFQLTAKLATDSLVRLLIPLNEDPMGETVEIREAAQDGDYKADNFALDVQLSDVSENNKLNPTAIKAILDSIPETAKRYKEADINKFANVPTDGSYSVVDENTPVTLDPTMAKTPSTGGHSSKPKPKPEEPTVVEATPTPIYRLYNRLNGEHLYTLDKNERDNLLTSDTWKDEGQAWIAPSESNYPVYRLLNPNNGDHHYTMDKNEFDTLPSYGWTAEGVAFFSADVNNPENVILHRLYNPNETGAGSHLYTVDTNERDTLEGLGWKYEGTAWAALPETK